MWEGGGGQDGVEWGGNGTTVIAQSINIFLKKRKKRKKVKGERWSLEHGKFSTS